MPLRRTATCALLLAVLGGCGGSQDQTSTDNTSGQPRLIVALGDSITAGSPGWDPDPAIRAQLDANDPKSQWEYWAQRDLGDGYEFRNCGVGGERTDAIAARLDACLDGADVAVLQGGVNDLVQRHPPEYAAENMRAMVERARADGLPVLVANLLPVNVGFPGITPKITRLNRLIAALTREEGVELIDFFDTLEDPPGSRRMPPAWTAEGLHPSVEGYKRLGRVVAGATRRALRAR